MIFPKFSRAALVWLCCTMLVSFALPGLAATLVDENFDDATASTLQTILTSSPTALPTGTVWSSSTNASAVNLRDGTDTINTYNPGNPLQRFAMSSGTTYFTPNTSANKFMVLGDDSAQLAGSPDKGIFGFAIPFKVSPGTTAVRVQFAWVFKAFVLPLVSTAGDTDRFVVGIAGNGFNINSPMAATVYVVDQSITNKGALQGPADVSIPVANLGEPDANGDYYLVFGFSEGTQASPATNGAVGIDNIVVSDDGTVTDPGDGGSGGSGGGTTPPPSPFVLPPASGGDPGFSSTHFLGSSNCTQCHEGLTDGTGKDVSIVTDWSSTMMANSARDPFWRAKVRSELNRHPNLASVINDKCTRCHAPMANFDAKTAGASLSIFDGGILSPTDSRHNLAMNGVSCTLCHRIEDSPVLGTLEGMSGQYPIDSTLTGTARKIYGPFEAPFSMPMQHMAGVTPTYSAHIKEAKLCASCHNLKTPYVDAAGNVLSTTPESEFPEQMPYSEWEHSSYVGQKTCQTCHMSRANGAKISVMPPWLSPRDGFAIHEFVGGNKLMLDILDKNKTQLGVLSSNFAETISKTDAMLKSAAKVELVSQGSAGGAMNFTVKVSSTTGHKLPTSYPSRRALLHVVVTDAQNQVVWESGKVNADGSVVGVDADSLPGSFEPHYDLITSPAQVQVYEAVMGNDVGAVTYTLLRGKSYLKDNRILPTGFNKQTASSDVKVVGDALADANFIGGSDTVSYRIAGLANGNYSVKAELVYQTLGYAFAQDLFTDTTTPEVVDFKTLFDASTQKSHVIADASFNTAVTPNQPPLAQAGPSRVVRLGSTVSLDGSASQDPDGAPQPLAFQWTQTNGPAIVLAQGLSPVKQFVPQAPGTYVFGLTVNDGHGTSGMSSVSITVPMLGEVDLDGDVDNIDLNQINAVKNTPAQGANDRRDLNGDGKIDLLDARKLVLLCTRPKCAAQ